MMSRIKYLFVMLCSIIFLFGCGEQPPPDLTDGAIDLISLLVKSELAPTRSEARRNIEQGGVTVDGEKVADVKATFTKDALSGDGMVIKRGKKKFKRVVLK